MTKDEMIAEFTKDYTVGKGRLRGVCRAPWEVESWLAEKYDQILSQYKQQLVEQIEQEKEALIPETLNDDTAFGAFRFIAGLNHVIALITKEK